MKKLLLFLMLIVATLSARAQVVYLTLDHDGQMVQKTNKDGKIYFAITGKVHNMKKVGTDKNGLDPTKFCVTANIGDGISSDLTVDKDTTFELRIPFNTKLDTKIAITCRSKEQCNGYISGPGISPYIMAKVGFEHKLETKGMTWDATTNKYTYTFQYKLRSSLAVTENGKSSPYYTDELQAVNPKDFDNVFSFSPANTGILCDDSYDGEQYNRRGFVSDSKEVLNDPFIYNSTDKTFTWTTSDKAGILKIVDPQKSEYNTIVEATIKAYTVHLTLQKTEHKIHAEVTDIMGNKVSGGKIYYSIGFHNSNSDITQQVFYENDLSHYNRVGNITEAKDLEECYKHEKLTEKEEEDFIKNFNEKPYYYLRTDNIMRDVNTGKKYSDPIDSTGVRTFNHLESQYYKSADLTDGAADIACDMDHWRTQYYKYNFIGWTTDNGGYYTPFNLEGSSKLCVYFWYSPDGNVNNNGSMFYAYKNMDDLQKEENMDAAEKKITSGKYTLELLDGTELEYCTYNDDDRNFYDNTGYRVTLQLKKDETADSGAELADGGYLDGGYTYQYEFKYKFASENADDNDLNELIIDYEGGNTSNWLSYVDYEKGQSNYFLPASNTNVKKFYLYSYLKLKSDDDSYSKEYLIAKNVYNTDGVVVAEKPKVDRECSTSIRYPSYLDGDVTGYGKDRVYDDLTGLLKKEWTGGPKFKDAIKGKTWRRDECYYYQVTGGGNLSQTIEAEKLPANESEYDRNTYTLQAIVRGEKGEKIQLHLTHGTDDGNNEVKTDTTVTVLGLGVDDNAPSTIDHNGCVDTIYTVLSNKELMDMGFNESDIPKGGWQKIEATVGSGESSDDLGITITSDKNFCLADVVLLLNANKKGGDTKFGHFLTTVPAIEGDKTGKQKEGDSDYDKLVLTDYKKFSFFDRGPNINRIVEMARGTVMNNCTGADSLYMPFNVVLPTIDNSGYKIYRLFLKDKEPYYWPDINGLGSVECDYISYDREFTAGKPSTIALPFSVPMDVIFDWCTNEGYKAVMGKYSWTPSPADQNWGVLSNVTDDGQVQLGQTWGYNSDGTIGGTLRTPKHDSNNSGNTLYYGPIMYLKTLKTGKPFMGMKSNENRPLVLYTSDRNVENNNYYPVPVSESDNGGMVRCGYMTNTDIDPEGKNYANFGTHQNEEGYNVFVGSFKKIDDLANVRNTGSFYDDDNNERTYHFYYWSAKDNKFKKVSEATDHPKKVSCPPFRAFLAIGQKTDASSPNPAKESLGMRFVDFYGSGTTTGIKDITTPSARMQPAANNVYSMTGVLVRRGTSLAGLPNGLYIVNGKKVIVNHN